MELAGVIAMSTKLFTLQALLDANEFSRYGFGRLYIYIIFGYLSPYDEFQKTTFQECMNKI
jgi:hypothetical protein